MVIRSVLGDIPAASLGFVQPHEHVLVDLSVARGRWDLEGQLIDEVVAITEVSAYRTGGGDSLVEMTTDDFGRSPEGLARVSAATGVNIIMGCGWYRQPYYPEYIDRVSHRELAAMLISEVVDGVGESGIRPGVIGEIGSDKAWLSAQEERVFWAAGHAQTVTGLGVMTHTPARAAMRQLDVLAAAGADLRRVAIGHADSLMSDDYHQQILKRGSYTCFDLVGQSVYPDAWRAQHIVSLIRQGFLNQILLSLDLCHRSRLTSWGGAGYGYLKSTFLPLLIEMGASTEELDVMTRLNPVQFLGGG